VRLDAPHAAHGERGLVGERPDRGGRGARREAGEIAEEGSPVEAPRAEPLRDREHNLAMRHTRHEERFYCFVPEWPASGELVLPGLRQAPRHVWMLGDVTRTSLQTRAGGNGLVVSLPRQASDPVCSVVALDFESEPTVG